MKYFMCFICLKQLTEELEACQSWHKKRVAQFGRGQKPGSIILHWLKLVRNCTLRQYNWLENGTSEGQKLPF